MIKEPRVVVPFGQMAGQMATVPQAIKSMGGELSQYSRLLESQAPQQPLAPSFSMRRYMWSFWLLEWQLLDPKTREHRQVFDRDLVEMVEHYHLKLPKDLMSLYNFYTHRA